MKTNKKIMSAILCTVMVAACFLPVKSVQAGGWQVVTNKKNVTLLLQKKTANDPHVNEYYLNIGKMVGETSVGMQGATKVTAKSSKEKVATAEGYVWKGTKPSEGQVFIVLKKAGTTKITTKVKKKGKWKTYKMNLKVVKYSNPVKKLTVNGVNIASQFKNRMIGTVDSSQWSAQVPISVTPAKNWKVKKITNWYWSSDYSKTYKQTFKNKKNVSVTYGESNNIHVILYNTKTKATADLLFG